MILFVESFLKLELLWISAGVNHVPEHM